MILAILEIIAIAFSTIMIAISKWLFLLYILPLSIEIVRDMRADEMVSFFRTRANAQTLLIMTILLISFGAFGVNINSDILNILITTGFILKNVLAADKLLKRNQVIKWTGYTIAGLLASFTLLSHGLSLEGLIELLPAIYIFIATRIALRWRVAGSVMFFGFAALALFEFLQSLAKSGIFLPGRIAVMALLVFPVAYLGFQSLRKEEVS